MDQTLLAFLGEYGLFAILLAILLEYACFPVSSEIILPVSGMLAAQIHTPLWTLIFLSVLAGLVGCSVCYWVGRCGDRVLKRLLRRFPKMARQFEKTCDWQRKYGTLAVMIGRVIPIFRTYISFVSGIIRQSYGVFLLFSSVGIAVWNTLLLSLGYFLGESANGLIPMLKRCLILLALLVLAAVAVRLFRKRKKASRHLKQSAPRSCVCSDTSSRVRHL